MTFKNNPISNDGVEERVVFVGGIEVLFPISIHRPCLIPLRRASVQVDFHISATGQNVLNIISTSPDGELLLTFTFE